MDAAEKHGLAVSPVLGVWVDWNDGSRQETWHRWDRNLFNVARVARRNAPMNGSTILPAAHSLIIGGGDVREKILPGLSLVARAFRR